MIFPEKEIMLKDGRIAVFRSPRLEDAAQLLQYLSDTARETYFLIRTPEECTMTLEQEENYIRNLIEKDAELCICCFIDGKLAGNCSLRPHRRIKTKHRASIGIALLREFWGLGIGTAMFEEMIAIGKQWGLMQLELAVIEGNDRAIALYKKMGFETISFVPNAIRMPDGSYVKEFLMVKTL